MKIGSVRYRIVVGLFCYVFLYTNCRADNVINSKYIVEDTKISDALTKEHFTEQNIDTAEPDVNTLNNGDFYSTLTEEKLNNLVLIQRWRCMYTGNKCSRSFDIDSSLDTVLIEVRSRGSPDCDIIDPDGKLVTVDGNNITLPVNKTKVKITSIKYPLNGRWSLTCGENKDYNITVKGSSLIDFTPSFIDNNSITTTGRPITGSNTTLTIEVSGLDNLYNVTDTVLTTLNGDLLSTYPAGKAIGRDRRLYKCHVMVPIQDFMVSITGYDMTGLPFERMFQTPIIPAGIKLTLEKETKVSWNKYQIQYRITNDGGIDGTYNISVTVDDKIFSYTAQPQSVFLKKDEHITCNVTLTATGGKPGDTSLAVVSVIGKNGMSQYSSIQLFVGGHDSTTTRGTDTQHNPTTRSTEILNKTSNSESTPFSKGSLSIKTTTITKGSATSAKGSITATTGNTISTKGNITATTGSTISTKGNITATTGSTISTKGNITATTGSTISTKGNITATTGSTISTKGNITATTGSTISTIGNITATTGSTISTKGNITATTGSTISTKGNITATTGSTISTKGNITATTGSTISTIGNITATTGSTISTKGNITATTGSTISTKGNITATTGSTISTKGNITATTGSTISTKGNIISTTGSIISTKGSIKSTTGSAISSKGSVTSSKGSTAPMTVKKIGSTFGLNNTVVSSSGTVTSMLPSGQTSVTDQTTSRMSDIKPPAFTKVDYIDNCRSDDVCDKYQWIVFFQVQDDESGVHRVDVDDSTLTSISIESFSDGLSKTPIHGNVSINCCKKQVTIIVEDMEGNRGRFPVHYHHKKRNSTTVTSSKDTSLSSIQIASIVVGSFAGCLVSVIVSTLIVQILTHRNKLQRKLPNKKLARVV